MAIEFTAKLPPVYLSA